MYSSKKNMYPDQNMYSFTFKIPFAQYPKPSSMVPKLISMVWSYNKIYLKNIKRFGRNYTVTYKL